MRDAGIGDADAVAGFVRGGRGARGCYSDACATKGTAGWEARA